MYPLSRGETNDVQDFSSEAGTINLALEVFHKEDQLLWRLWTERRKKERKKEQKQFENWNEHTKNKQFSVVNM